MRKHKFDVVVVGGGSAGLAAAIRTAQLGASVGLIEKAPKRYRGGNSSLTANIRFAYELGSALSTFLDSGNSRTEALLYLSTLPRYPAAQFIEEWLANCGGRLDAEKLVRIIARDSYRAALWLRAMGNRWRLRSHHLPSQMPIELVGGGAAMIENNFGVAERIGVEIVYDAPVVSFHKDIDYFSLKIDGASSEIFTKKLVLACGGFEASSKLRSRFLGERWREVSVRGVPYNTGDGLVAAARFGASLVGQMSECHAPPQLVDVPESSLPGDRLLIQLRSRYAYAFGITVDAEGERFFDEGFDFANRTYGDFGAHLAGRKSPIAYQVFDSTAYRSGLIANSYFMTPPWYTADTLAKLSAQIPGGCPKLQETVVQFNCAARSDTVYCPQVLDGYSTVGLSVPKSNWAAPIAAAPYYAFPVCAAVTFTYGGLSVDENGMVLSKIGGPIDGLYACGEMVGGLFSKGYLGGAGLIAGVVMGLRAAEHACKAV